METKTNGKKTSRKEVLDAMVVDVEEKHAREEIEILPLVRQRIKLAIRGTVPLCMNAFSEKAKRIMREKQAGEAQVKAPKSPKECFEAAFYTIPTKKGEPRRYGFPAGAFKNAMVSVANTFIEGMTKVLTRGALFVLAEHRNIPNVPDLIEIHGEVVGGPETNWNEMPVRNASGVADLRYRPLIDEGWTAVVEIEFDPSNIKAAQVANLLARAGFHVGIGDGRPEKKTDMGWGRFEVVEQVE